MILVEIPWVRNLLLQHTLKRRAPEKWASWIISQMLSNKNTTLIYYPKAYSRTTCGLPEGLKSAEICHAS